MAVSATICSNMESNSKDLLVLGTVCCGYFCSVGTLLGYMLASACIINLWSVARMLRDMNKLSDPPTWAGSATDIAACIRALEIYQLDSLEDLEQRVVTEIGIEIPELRNVIRYDRGTQQKRDDSDLLNSLFEYAEYELPFQCPPNSPLQLTADVCLGNLTLRMQNRRLCCKFYSNVRARRIMYYTGSQWNQPPGYLEDRPAYMPLLEDYDTIHRRHALARVIADIYCVPNLAEYVFKREIGLRYPRLRNREDS